MRRVAVLLGQMEPSTMVRIPHYTQPWFVQPLAGSRGPAIIPDCCRISIVMWLILQPIND
ncbi:MAG: hypothetical protein LUQ38_03310 [Methanotrichaceae archaeon]|nr:hypothetical protein [Methanotrichaceae archaeon]